MSHWKRFYPISDTEWEWVCSEHGRTPCDCAKTEGPDAEDAKLREVLTRTQMHRMGPGSGFKFGGAIYS